MPKATTGTDLMNQLSPGELHQKSSEVASKVKDHVSVAMEEIITMGARVRPLKLNGLRVGWLRPLAYAERKVLDRQIDDDDERVLLTMKYCTTLTEDEILDLDIFELNSILHRIYDANLADLSLFPYISAFVSTQVSHNLWTSKTDLLFNRDEIRLLDGRTMRFIAMPDHLRLWASLATLRVDSINKLERTLNFGTLIKAQIGKGADKYVNELIRALNGFQTDLIEPWTEVVDFMKLQHDIPQFGDGFGHSHQDSSVQGLMREMHGMLQGDKHEQLMDTFYQKQLTEAQQKEAEIQDIVQRRRKALDEMEDDGAMVVVTDAEVRRREREIRARSSQTFFEKQLAFELENQDEVVEEGNARMAKYFSKEQ
jgi:hypothetical protein